MIYKFMSKYQKFPIFMVVDILDEVDGNVQRVIELVQDLIKSLDEIKNHEEKCFLRSQIVKLRQDVTKGFMYDHAERIQRRIVSI